MKDGTNAADNKSEKNHDRASSKHSNEESRVAAWLAAVRFFEDPKTEAAYVAYAHRNAWLRFGLLPYMFAQVCMRFVWVRTRMQAADEPAYLLPAMAAHAAIIVTLCVGVLLTLPPAMRALRRCAPRVAAEYFPGNGAHAFEWLLLAIVLVHHTVDRLIFCHTRILTDHSGGTTTVLSWISYVLLMIAPSPPRFWPLGPCLLAHVAVQVGVGFAWHSREADVLGVVDAVGRGAVVDVVTAWLLWVWDAERRQDFRRIQETRRRAAHVAAAVGVLQQHAETLRIPVSPAAGTNFDDTIEVPVTPMEDSTMVTVSSSASAASNIERSVSVSGTNAVVHFQFQRTQRRPAERKDSPAAVEFAALASLRDAVALAVHAAELRGVAVAPCVSGLLVIIPEQETPLPIASACASPTLGVPPVEFPANTSCRTNTPEPSTTATCVAGTLFASLVLRHMAATAMKSPTETPRDSVSHGWERVPRAEESTFADFVAIVVFGTVEIAAVGPDAPAGASAVSGDAVSRALEVARLEVPPGTTLLSEEVREALGGQLATSFVRSYAVPALPSPNICSGDGGNADGVNDAPEEHEQRRSLYVRGSSWATEFREAETRLLRVMGSYGATPRSMTSSDSLVRSSSLGDAQLTSPGATSSSLSAINPSAHKYSYGATEADKTSPPGACSELPKFRFRVPYGLLFDDPELEAEFRRQEFSGPSRLGAAVVMVYCSAATPLLAWLGGARPDDLAFVLWGLQLLLAIIALVVSVRVLSAPLTQTLLGVAVLALPLPVHQLLHAGAYAARVYAADAQYNIELLQLVLWVPSAVPWCLPIVVQGLTSVERPIAAEERRAVPEFFAPLMILFALSGLAFAVYGHRARQRSRFASLVAAHASLERWAAMRARLERRLQLALWPAAARELCDAVARGAPVAVPRPRPVWVLPVALPHAPASCLRDVALAAAGSGALSARPAVHVVPGAVLVVEDASSDAGGKQLQRAALELVAAFPRWQLRPGVPRRVDVASGLAAGAGSGQRWFVVAGLDAAFGPTLTRSIQQH